MEDIGSDRYTEDGEGRLSDHFGLLVYQCMVGYIRERFMAAAVKLLRLSCEEVQRLIREQATDMRGVTRLETVGS